MQKRRFAIVAMVAAFLLAGCESLGGPKQTGGTLVGAAAGGLLGSQFGSGSGQLAMTGAGVLLGAFLGSEIGSSLDRSDQLYAQQTANQAFESGRSGSTYRWSNPDSGHSGTITPQQVSSYQGGQPCRRYTQTVYVDGRAETVTGSACRNPDGTWTIVN